MRNGFSKTVLLLLTSIFGVLVFFGYYVIIRACDSTNDRYVGELQAPYDTIEMQDYESGTNGKDTYGSITYQGRTYLLYSLADRFLKDKEIASCVGCIEQDGEIHEDEMVLTLSYNDSDDYLIVFYEGPDLMGIPTEVYRAEDTRGEEIEKPDFVKNPQQGDLMYAYWLNN